MVDCDVGGELARPVWRAYVDLRFFKYSAQGIALSDWIIVDECAWL